jgi:hypothetical protein
MNESSAMGKSVEFEGILRVLGVDCDADEDLSPAEVVMAKKLLISKS